jgi:pumilio RNA-binding family
MTDQFGNYLCQKIMEVASDDYLKDIVDNILDSINQVVINVHGTRSVQALIETLNKKLSIFEVEIMKIIN